MAVPPALRIRTSISRQNSHVRANYSDVASRQRASIKKFRGHQCPVLAWDGLRKDSDLWLEDGDCLVHLYAYGASRRGPSFRVRLADVEGLASTYLMDDCLYIGDNDASDYPPGYDIFVPAMNGLARNEAYSYHLATRNCFAFAADLPIVGQRLGDALVELWDRLQQWDSQLVTPSRFMKYCESQGYLEMSANTGHALAMLAVAERLRDTSLYIDAFVHCVGMQDRLDFNPEYLCVTDRSKALINQAAIEMDLHIEHVLHSLSTFLEDELGTEHLGLSKPARDHLDRFRSFLINHYVEKLGYYPPPANRPWKKRLWISMYQSFYSLYDYLSDRQSSDDSANSQGATGGICVVQNVHAFDQRHGYEPLPHPLPLLPDAAVTDKHKLGGSDLATGIRHMRLGRSSSLQAQSPAVTKALESAANTDDKDVLASSLVTEYRRFERRKLEEKLGVAEARKVRWLLVYGVLQMLTSVVRAPAEVRDARTPPYPLCVLTTNCPPWDETYQDDESNRGDAVQPLSIPTKSHARQSSLILQPDCEADTAHDYFAASNASPPSTASSTPGAASSFTTLSRASSMRSSISTSVSALHRSILDGSRRRKNGILRSASTHGSINSRTSGTRAAESLMELTTGASSTCVANEAGPRVESRFEMHQPSVPSRRSSQASTADSASSGSNTPSTRSSYKDACDSPITEASSGDEEACSSRRSIVSTTTTLNAGCYQPTGFVENKVRSSIVHKPSTFSIQSGVSSVYPDDSQQADDIAEVQARGRARMTAPELAQVYSNFVVGSPFS